MTLRRFLIGATTASFLLTAVPIIVCALVAALQHSDAAWYAAWHFLDSVASFSTVWLLASILLPIAVLIFSTISFLRRDFMVGVFAVCGSLSALVCLWILITTTLYY